MAQILPVSMGTSLTHIFSSEQEATTWSVSKIEAPVRLSASPAVLFERHALVAHISFAGAARLPSYSMWLYVGCTLSFTVNEVRPRSVKTAYHGVVLDMFSRDGAVPLDAGSLFLTCLAVPFVEQRPAVAAADAHRRLAARPGEARLLFVSATELHHVVLPRQPGTVAAAAIGASAADAEPQPSAAESEATESAEPSNKLEARLAGLRPSYPGVCDALLACHVSPDNVATRAPTTARGYKSKLNNAWSGLRAPSAEDKKFFEDFSALFARFGKTRTSTAGTSEPKRRADDASLSSASYSLTSLSVLEGLTRALQPQSAGASAVVVASSAAAESSSSRARVQVSSSSRASAEAPSAAPALVAPPELAADLSQPHAIASAFCTRVQALQSDDAVRMLPEHWEQVFPLWYAFLTEALREKDVLGGSSGVADDVAVLVCPANSVLEAHTLISAELLPPLDQMPLLPTTPPAEENERVASSRQAAFAILRERKAAWTAELAIFAPAIPPAAPAAGSSSATTSRLQGELDDARIALNKCHKKISKLERQLEKERALVTSLNGTISEQREQISQLRATGEALAEDAERYACEAKRLLESCAEKDKSERQERAERRRMEQDHKAAVEKARAEAVAASTGELQQLRHSNQRLTEKVVKLKRQRDILMSTQGTLNGLTSK